MNRQAWAAISAGLLAWAALVVILWTTGPYDCSIPNQHGKVHCR